MGYEVHITRCADRMNPAGGQAISESEWEQTCIATPGLADLGWWDDGEIHFKQLEDDGLIRVVRAATKLGARVEGDDGERYELDAESQLLVDGEAWSRVVESTNRTVESGKRWFWVASAVMVGAFGLVAYRVAMWLFASATE